MKNKDRLGKGNAKRLIAYAFRFKKSLIFGLIFMVFAMLLQLLSPFIIRNLMDNELPKEHIDLSRVIAISGVYLLVMGLESVFHYFSGIQLRVTAMKVITDMRQHLYRKIHSLPVSYFDSKSSGTIVSHITNDTAAVQSLYIKVLGQILISSGYIFGIYVALFFINPAYALLMSLILPLFIGLMYFYNRKGRTLNDIIRKKIGEMNGMLNEAISGISIIQVYNQQDRVKRRYEVRSKENYQSRMKLLVLNSAMTYNAIGFLRDICFILLVYYFGNAWLAKQMDTSAGMLYVYIGYTTILFHHMTQIMEQLQEMEKANAAANHVFALLDTKSPTLPQKRGMLHIEGNVTMEGVSFYYKDEEYVLRDIHIKANKGETIAIVGHTGSGKSSLMNLLLKFYTPQKGRITIDGMDLNTLHDMEIRQHLGIVLQEPFLFSGTVLSNITLDNQNITKEQAINALKMVGGESILNALEHGIDTAVVEKGATLSSGQRQLITFARALAHDPKILVLDEATSSVDSETEQIIQNAMRVLMKNRTTFVIAHRLSTIKHADRIYLLRKGRIAEEGTHDELIALKGRYYKMYQMQSR